jgi:hypothetical protein
MRTGRPAEAHRQLARALRVPRGCANRQLAAFGCVAVHEPARSLVMLSCVRL